MSTVSVLNTDSGLSGKTLVNAEDTQTITGAKTFSRSPNPPFVVTAASGNVTNLDADKLDGQDGSFYQSAANLNAGIIPPLRLGLHNLCDGRLTLTTASPVTTSDVTGAGTIYFSPYKGGFVGLYDGSATWKVYALTEKSLALTLTSGNVYDVFLYDNSGTPTLETLIWTNGTTRATALVFQDGIYVKSGATTRRYLGTIYASGSNTTEDSVLKRYVWNYYNRLDREMTRSESNTTWTYNTATIRQANGSGSNQLDFVIGVSEDAVVARVQTSASNGTGGTQFAVGVGLDSTSAFSGFYAGAMAAASNVPVQFSGEYRGKPGIGKHFLSWNEWVSAAAGNTTFYSNTAQNNVSGIATTIKG